MTLAAEAIAQGAGEIELTGQSDPFHKLVRDISGILGPNSGLKSEDVDVQDLKNLMENYVSSKEDWGKYAFVDYSRGYTRNLVDKGNENSNLLVLVWSPGKGSPIHDHAASHCLMKVLKGSLIETLYETPETEGTPLKIINETVYAENGVTYICDDLGLHRVSNPDQDEVAVSLHLYTPPNAAKFGCCIFDKKTGKKSHITQGHFFSEFGQKI